MNKNIFIGVENTIAGTRVEKKEKFPLGGSLFFNSEENNLGTLFSEYFKTVTHQAPLSMGFSRQEYWHGLPSSPGDLPNPGIKPMSPALAGRFFNTESPEWPYFKTQIANKLLVKFMFI